jgi:hypothetical protein
MRQPNIEIGRLFDFKVLRPPDRLNERPHFCVVLFAGRTFHAAGNTQVKRFHFAHGLGINPS